jgi:hypothetical protein
MEVTTENISPKRAETYLNHNKGNRKLRDGIVEKYADDMRNKRWTQCAAPIAFFEDGDIADGQHRLWAIIESSTTQRFAVMRGLSREAGLNIDTGAARSLVDNAKISGVDTDLTNELVATAQAVATGERNCSGRSASARLQCVADHREAARWAVSNGPRGRGYRNAMIMGAVARAYYHESDKDRLRRFCDVFASGFADGNHESAAIAIRNYIQAKGMQSLTTAMWRDSFLKVQNAISYFMRGKALSVIKRVADEAYPLPKQNPKK